jgi:hypothetical protein
MCLVRVKDYSNRCLSSSDHSLGVLNPQPSVHVVENQLQGWICCVHTLDFSLVVDVVFDFWILQSAAQGTSDVFVHQFEVLHKKIR